MLSDICQIRTYVDQSNHCICKVWVHWSQKQCEKIGDKREAL